MSGRNWRASYRRLSCEPDNLIEVDAVYPRGYQYTVYLDPESLARQGMTITWCVISVVLVSSTGVRNVTVFEGLHCGERKYRRIYAYGVNDQWQPLA